MPNQRIIRNNNDNFFGCYSDHFAITRYSGTVLVLLASVSASLQQFNEPLSDTSGANVQCVNNSLFCSEISSERWVIFSFNEPASNWWSEVLSISPFFSDRMLDIKSNHRCAFHLIDFNFSIDFERKQDYASSYQKTEYDKQNSPNEKDKETQQKNLSLNSIYTAAVIYTGDSFTHYYQSVESGTFAAWRSYAANINTNSSDRRRNWELSNYD